MMNRGKMLRKNFIDLLRTSGEEILVSREYGNEIVKITGIKMPERGRKLITFRFSGCFQVNFGQVLIPLSSGGYWVIHGTKRVVISDEFVCFAIYCQQTTASHACVPGYLRSLEYI